MKTFKYIFLFLIVIIIAFFVVLYQFILPDSAPTDLDWTKEQKNLPQITMSWDIVDIKYIRDFNYFWTWEKVNYLSWSYNIDDLKSAYLFTSEFWFDWKIAHNFISFEFENDQYLWISVESRREKWNEYNLIDWAFRQYPLVYMIATEEDLVRTRKEDSWETLRFVEFDFTNEELESFFKTFILSAKRSNENPQFYHTIFDNCSTRIVDNINDSTNYNIWYSYKILFPWLFDKYLHENWLIRHSWNFDSQLFNISYSTWDILNNDFSKFIRE